MSAGAAVAVKTQQRVECQLVLQWL